MRIVFIGMPATNSSCPGLSRASTFFCAAGKVVDGRDKPGHDDLDTPVRKRQRHMRLPYPLTISPFRPLAALPKVAMMLSLPPFLRYLGTKGA